MALHLGKTSLCLNFRMITAKCWVTEKLGNNSILPQYGVNLVIGNHENGLLSHQLIVYPCSGICHGRCRCPQCSNIFSSETAWPIKAKFHVDPPSKGGTKAYINGPGHMTEMALMPIYGKNF